MATETARAVDFKLPSLGSDMEEGTVIEWLVSVGDRADKGDVLLRVDTEKAEIDVEVWHDAVVVELLVEPGDTVPVGTILARLETGADVAAAASAETAPAPSPESVPLPGSLLDEAVDDSSPAPTPAAAAAPTTGVSPKSARGSDDLSNDLPAPVQMLVDALPGETSSQPGPRADVSAVEAVVADPRLVFWPTSVDQASVRQPQPTSPASPEPTEAKPMSRADRRQAAVAALMERSNREIPHFHLVRAVDVTSLMDWLDARNDPLPPTERILPAAVFLYAVARAAAGSVVNGTVDGTPVEAEHVDLGVAVHVRGGGLMTPVLPAAENLALPALMNELQAMVGRARSGRLNTNDMTPATLTVTNMGDSGVDHVLGVIRPPERALVGFGRVVERAVVIDGAVAVRSMVDVTLSADHRVINGQAAARFLDAVNSHLTAPDTFDADTGNTETSDTDDTAGESS